MSQFILVPDPQSDVPTSGWARRYSWLAAFYKNQIAIQFATPDDKLRAWHPELAEMGTQQMAQAKFISSVGSSDFGPPFFNFDDTPTDLLTSGSNYSGDVKLKSQAIKAPTGYYYHYLNLIDYVMKYSTRSTPPSSAYLQFGVAAIDYNNKPFDAYPNDISIKTGPQKPDTSAADWKNFESISYIPGYWYGLWCVLGIDGVQHLIDPLLLLMSWSNSEDSNRQFYQGDRSLYASFKKEVTNASGTKTQSDFMFPAWLAKKIWMNNNQLTLDMYGNPEADKAKADADKAKELAAKCDEKLGEIDKALASLPVDPPHNPNTPVTTIGEAKTALDAYKKALEDDKAKIEEIKKEAEKKVADANDATKKEHDDWYKKWFDENQAKTQAEIARDNAKASAQKWQDADKECEEKLTQALIDKKAAEAARDKALSSGDKDRAAECQKLIDHINEGIHALSMQLGSKTESFPDMIAAAKQLSDNLKACDDKATKYHQAEIDCEKDLAALKAQLTAAQTQSTGSPKDQTRINSLAALLHMKQRELNRLRAHNDRLKAQLRAAGKGGGSGKIVFTMAMFLIIGSVALGLLTTRDRKI